MAGDRGRLASGSHGGGRRGPVTAKPLQDKGIIPLIPDRGRLGALVRALVSHFEQAQSTAVLTTAGPCRSAAPWRCSTVTSCRCHRAACEVLRLLADAGGDVVTREQVLAVLPGESEDPHTAEVAVARLRDVCGRALVQTVVKRGYRLVTA